jgi:hypothetical protein
MMVIPFRATKLCARRTLFRVVTATTAVPLAFYVALAVSVCLVRTASIQSTISAAPFFAEDQVLGCVRAAICFGQAWKIAQDGFVRLEMEGVQKNAY